MNDNPLVNDDDEFSWIVNPKSKTGNDLATGELPGNLATLEQTSNMMQSLQNAVMDTHVGVNVSRAMAQVMNNIAENNPEMRNAIMGDIEQLYENADDDDVDYLNDIDEVVREHFDLPAVVADAVINTEENASTELAAINPTWHGLVNTNRAFSESIRRLSNQVFSMFPCYQEGVARQGAAHADNINVIFNMKLRENAGNMERQGYQMARNFLASEKEIDSMAAWIAKNGAVVEKTDVTFTGLTPNNYSAQMVMAVTEDRTFLLVKEDSGLAEYSFNDETGDMIVSVKEGKTLNNGDLLKVLPFQSEEDFNFLDGTGLSIITMNDGNLGIVYDGAEPVHGGHEFRTRIMHYGDLPHALKNSITESLGYMGDFAGKSAGVSPVDAKYVYTWEGGRRHYLENPGSRDQLKALFSGNRVQRNMVFENNQIEADEVYPQLEEHPAPDVVNIETVRPVTRPEVMDDGQSNNRKLPHMQMLLKNKQFVKGLTAADELCVFKVLPDGNLCIITSANDRKLPIANTFNIVISSDRDIQNLEAKTVSLDELETEVDKILNSSYDNKI